MIIIQTEVCFLEKLRRLVWQLKNLSPRASVAAVTIAQIIPKPIGYIRLVLVAYLFGASAGMDAYNVAEGALGLLLGLPLSIVQTAVIPNLMRLSAKDDTAARSFFAWIARFVMIWGAVMAAAVVLFPREVLWLFAAQLDDARVNIARVMLMIVLPASYVRLLGSMVVIWGNYKKSYSVQSVVTAPAGVLALVLMLIFVPFMGVYSVPASISIAGIIFTLMAYYLLRDMPLKPRTPVPRDVLRKTGHDAIMSLGMLAAGVLYGVTDRWFAAGMAAGNMTALSYATLVSQLPTMITAACVNMFLTHSSRVSSDSEALHSSLNKALAIGWAYMLPVAFGMAAAAKPIISMALGYGAFDATAVSITASCVAVQALVLPLGIWSNLMGQFGLATSRLKLILGVSYVSVFLNVVLDWLFAPIWGAAGLCAATSLNQASLGIYYIYRMAPKGTFALHLPWIARQTAFAAVWAAALYQLSDSKLATFTVGAALGAAHLFVCERMGWMRDVPAGWRPTEMCAMVLSRFKRPRDKKV